MTAHFPRDRQRIPELKDPICERAPDQIAEYRAYANAEGVTPDEWVWREEGTLDRATGQFLCTSCHLALGPSSPTGRWTATPENLAIFKP